MAIVDSNQKKLLFLPNFLNENYLLLVDYKKRLALNIFAIRIDIDMYEVLVLRLHGNFRKMQSMPLYMALMHSIELHRPIELQ